MKVYSVLKIIKLNKVHEYFLQDIKTNKEYRLILEFYGIDYPKVNDFLLLDENLLNPNHERYCQPYAFGILEASNTKLDKIDLVGLITKDKQYLLQRMYG